MVTELFIKMNELEFLAESPDAVGEFAGKIGAIMGTMAAMRLPNDHDLTKRLFAAINRHAEFLRAAEARKIKWKN